jgi:hypothetical protein
MGTGNLQGKQCISCRKWLTMRRFTHLKVGRAVIFITASISQLTSYRYSRSRSRIRGKCAPFFLYLRIYYSQYPIPAGHSVGQSAHESRLGTSGGRFTEVVLSLANHESCRRKRDRFPHKFNSAQGRRCRCSHLDTSIPMKSATLSFV